MEDFEIEKIKGYIFAIFMSILILAFCAFMSITYVSRSIDNHNVLYERHLNMLNKQDSLVKVISFKNMQYSKLLDDYNHQLLVSNDLLDEKYGMGRYAKK